MTSFLPLSFDAEMSVQLAELEKTNLKSSGVLRSFFLIADFRITSSNDVVVIIDVIGEMAGSSYRTLGEISGSSHKVVGLGKFRCLSLGKAPSRT